MPDFIHPETGEVLCSQEEWKAALVSLEEKLAPIYRTRRTLREAYAERFAAPELPPKTRRTDVQEKVVRCPRCGQSYKSEEAAE